MDHFLISRKVKLTWTLGLCFPISILTLEEIFGPDCSFLSGQYSLVSKEQTALRLHSPHFQPNAESGTVGIPVHSASPTLWSNEAKSEYLLEPEGTQNEQLVLPILDPNLSRMENGVSCEKRPRASFITDKESKRPKIYNDAVTFNAIYSEKKLSGPENMAPKDLPSSRLNPQCKSSNYPSTFGFHTPCDSSSARCEFETHIKPKSVSFDSLKSTAGSSGESCGVNDAQASHSANSENELEFQDDTIPNVEPRQEKRYSIDEEICLMETDMKKANLEASNIRAYVWILSIETHVNKLSSSMVEEITDQIFDLMKRVEFPPRPLTHKIRREESTSNDKFEAYDSMKVEEKGINLVTDGPTNAFPEDRVQDEVLFKAKVNILLRKIYTLNGKLLELFGIFGPDSLYDTEQQCLLRWIFALIFHEHLSLSERLNQENMNLASLKKVIVRSLKSQKKIRASNAINDRSHYEEEITEMDILNKVAVLTLGSYYKLTNIRKWNAIFLCDIGYLKILSILAFKRYYHNFSSFKAAHHPYLDIFCPYPWTYPWPLDKVNQACEMNPFKFYLVYPITKWIKYSKTTPNRKQLKNNPKDMEKIRIALNQFNYKSFIINDFPDIEHLDPDRSMAKAKVERKVYCYIGKAQGNHEYELCNLGLSIQDLSKKLHSQLPEFERPNYSTLYGIHFILQKLFFVNKLILEIMEKDNCGKLFMPEQRSILFFTVNLILSNHNIIEKDEPIYNENLKYLRNMVEDYLNMIQTSSNSLLKEYVRTGFKENQMDMVTSKIAIHIAGSYYKINNYEKWDTLFSSDMDFLKLVTILVGQINSKNRAKFKRLRCSPFMILNLLPWDKVWTSEEFLKGQKERDSFKNMFNNPVLHWIESYGKTP